MFEKGLTKGSHPCKVEIYSRFHSTRRLQMELCHKNSILENPAIQRLGQFVREQHKQWNRGVPDLEQYERELHEYVMAVECELLGDELARYDVSVEQIEVEGAHYGRTFVCA